MVRNGNSARGAASRPLSACDVIHALKTNRTDLKSRDTSSHQGPDHPSSIVAPIAQPIAIPSLTEIEKRRALCATFHPRLTASLVSSAPVGSWPEQLAAHDTPAGCLVRMRSLLK